MYKPCLNARKNIIKSIILFLSILVFNPLLFADTPARELQQQARIYRAQGLGYQQRGELDQALSLYQKAIALDPLYAVAYNDAGIICEAKGDLKRAEEYYLKAVQVDPDYLSPYSNLALFYENKRNLPQAAFYWDKRANLGFSRDHWTQRARQRFDDIQAVLAEKKLGYKEQDLIDFMQDIVEQKSVANQDNKTLAREYFKKAKLSYKRKEWLTALKEAIDAESYDPNNRRISKFLNKVRMKLLSEQTP